VVSKGDGKDDNVIFLFQILLMKIG